jgi:hypothetical protein
LVKRGKRSFSITTTLTICVAEQDRGLKNE